MGSRFFIDDEGFVTGSQTPAVALSVANSSTGALAITFEPLGPWNSTSYTGSGTASETAGTSSVSVTFTYGYLTPAHEPVSYAYTGAIAIADQSCDIVMAGTYTQTVMLPTLIDGFLGFRSITTGPYPFSAKLEPLIN